MEYPKLDVQNDAISLSPIHQGYQDIPNFGRLSGVWGASMYPIIGMMQLYQQLVVAFTARGSFYAIIVGWPWNQSDISH